MLGKEEGLFFPSGVMGNLASVMSHCWERGSEVLVGDLSHIVMYEQGGISTVSYNHEDLLTKGCKLFSWETFIQGRFETHRMGVSTSRKWSSKYDQMMSINQKLNLYALKIHTIDALELFCPWISFIKYGENVYSPEN